MSKRLQKSSSGDTGKVHPYMRGYDIAATAWRTSDIIREGHLGEGVYQKVTLILDGKVVYTNSL